DPTVCRGPVPVVMKRTFGSGAVIHPATATQCRGSPLTVSWPYGVVSASSGSVTCNRSRPNVRAPVRVAGSLPATDDILSRSLGVSIGVSDNYLDAGFGVTVNSDSSAINRAAAQLSAAFETIRG
ncbi:hypothetical protein ACPZ19_50860, partial [Amycolatopsis lurida]